MVTRLQDGLRLDCRQTLCWDEIFSSEASRMVLGPTQPPIQWAPRTLYLWYSPQSSADVKNEWSFTSISPMAWTGPVLPLLCHSQLLWHLKRSLPQIFINLQVRRTTFVLQIPQSCKSS